MVRFLFFAICHQIGSRYFIYTKNITEITMASNLSTLNAVNATRVLVSFKTYIVYHTNKNRIICILKIAKEMIYNCDHRKPRLIILDSNDACFLYFRRTRTVAKLKLIKRMITEMLVNNDTAPVTNKTVAELLIFEETN